MMPADDLGQPGRSPGAHRRRRSSGAAQGVRRRGGVARLTREARMLTLARHPGVVTLIGLERTPERARLTTAGTGSHTLATWPCPSAERAAGVIAALAETVADLHQLGIAHGRITADHVLIDQDGRPVLTGFAEAVCGTGGAGGADVVGAVDVPPVPPVPPVQPIQAHRDRLRPPSGVRHPPTTSSPSARCCTGWSAPQARSRGRHDGARATVATGAARSGRPTVTAHPRRPCHRG